MRKLFLPLLALLFTACLSDNYDSGKGDYSNVMAELVTFPLDGENITYGELDDSRRIVLTTPISKETIKNYYQAGVWDHKVRMLMYFDNKSEDATTVTGEPISGMAVYMPTVTLSDTIKDPIKTDPVKLRSAWMAKNEKYLNLCVTIMTGNANSNTQRHTIGFVCDSIRSQAGSSEADVYLRFVHDQNNLPEYYSVDTYLSITKEQLKELVTKNLPEAADKEIKTHLSINTYTGVETKEL